MVLKREDLNHTGAHKINNTIGQALLALRMGKRRIIAETGAGQHGVATATVCARFGLECVVYMGAEDVRAAAAQRVPHAAAGRHGRAGRVRHPNAQGRHQRSDARLGDQRTDHALHHRLGGGPGPLSRMVRDFQSVIGREARAQMLARYGRLPHTVVACVGGGSNAMGIFQRLPRRSPTSGSSASRRPAKGLDAGHHSATLSAGTPGVLHGSLSYLLQDADGQVSRRIRSRPGSTIRASAGAQLPARQRPRRRTSPPPMPRRWSVSGGLPHWRALFRRSRLPTHSPGCGESAGSWPGDAIVLVCLSGRGDKDVAHVAALLGDRSCDAVRTAFRMSCRRPRSPS